MNDTGFGINTQPKGNYEKKEIMEKNLKSLITTYAGIPTNAENLEIKYNKSEA
jgi:hypothetical protein